MGKPSSSACFSCGKVGHWTKDCPSRGGTVKSGGRKGPDSASSPSPKRQKVENTENELAEDEIAFAEGCDDFGAEMEENDLEAFGLAEQFSEEPMKSSEKKSPPSKKIQWMKTGVDSPSFNHYMSLPETRRPPLANMDPSESSLVVQQFELDYYVDRKRANMPSGSGQNANEKAPVIRMFGLTHSGNSVLVHVHGFQPYFYVPSPSDPTAGQIEGIRRVIDTRLKERSSDAGMTTLCTKIELFHRLPLMMYTPSPVPFLKIFVAIPSLVPTARSFFERGTISLPDFPLFDTTTYESNIQFGLRFMCDRNIVGAGWCEIDQGKWIIRSPGECVSRVQMEVDAPYDAIVSYSAEGKWLNVAPIRLLSFDIECAARKGHFPEADKDPVIQIANYVTDQGSTHPVTKNVFCLNSCAPIAGAHVVSFDTEQELLLGWSRFVRQLDPDIVTGYNVNNFDFPYLINRADNLHVTDFAHLGRLTKSMSRVKDARFQSRAWGTRESKQVNLEGRVIYDVLQAVSREYKLRSYTLNNVSAHFLGEMKEEVHHSIITDLQNGNDETRRRLAVYCLKDSYLPTRLIEKLMLLVNAIEMVRVTGVPLSYLLSMGQQIKVLSQLYRSANTEGYLIPNIVKTAPPEDGGVGYEGATVIEPKRAFHVLPIATLDFSSLYPSIMISHNLCYSTLVPPTHVDRYAPEDVTKTPTGDVFVKSHVRKGILPQILMQLLSARKKAKGDLKDAEDPLLKLVLNGRQLALKISANSVYGFTGALVGRLPCLPISASTTAFGRQMIQRTSELVREKYCKSNGFPFDSEIVYGDTDSVMVRFGVSTVAEALELGKEAAKYVTTHFIGTINLEFEKVYYPYLLINKKRYAGLYWTNADKHDRMDCKGIETVRRDNCPLVKNVITVVLNKILIDRDTSGAVAYVKGMIADLLQNKMDLSELVISKQLTKTDYDVKTAHSVLAEKLKKRDPGHAPHVGDRIPYVIVRAGQKAKAYEKAEDPIYVLEHNIPLDTQYYLENQLAKPLMRIFEPIMKNPQELLRGDHTRVISIPTPSKGTGMMKFAVKSLRCLGCRGPLGKGETAVCSSCRSERGNGVYLEKSDRVCELEELYSRLWTECQQCQHSLFQEVLCSNSDCPIFYRRRKIMKDLEAAQETLQRWGIPHDC